MTGKDRAREIINRLAGGGDAGDLPDNLLLHASGYAFGSPGIVVDELKARATPCKYVEYAPGKRIAWSPGIVGALTDEQERLYCPSWVRLERPGVVRRLRNWQEAVDTCKAEIAGLAERHERLETFLGCMSRELKSRGIEV